MWLAGFYIWGTLLAFSVCDICPENAASWVKLNPLGDCGDEEVLCPYRLTLPPLSIQLPRPFRELEEMAKELQNLKEMVNQLRRDCQECKGKHSIERGGWTDHGEGEERTPQHPRINISIMDTQSRGGEKVTRIFTSTLPQGDTSESEGTIKGSEKRPNPSILDGREWNVNQRIDSTQGSTELISEVSREVKIFNPLLDEVPEDISKVLKPAEITEPSLAMKKDDEQSATHGKLQPNVLSDGHAKNISDILTARRRVQNVPDRNGLRDPSTKTMDLITSAGNRRVVNFSGGGRPFRPRGSYINSRVVSVGDRLKNPAFGKKTDPQVAETMDKTEPEEEGFSPARSGIMRVKETSPRIANTKSGGISGASPSTDDQNKQDISRVSGPKTDDEHASQFTRVSEDSLRNINKTKITRIPTNLRKEKQGDVSHIDANKSGSSIINSAKQPNLVKEEKEHMGLSESLVVISSPEVNREDLPFPGRQVEIEKHLNPITVTNNGQIGSSVLDEADSTFNARTVNPLSPNPTDEMQIETFIAGAIEETGLNLLNTETVNIQRNSKATFSEDLVNPTIIPTVKSKSINTNVRMTSRSKSPVGGHGTRRPSKIPLKDVAEHPHISKKNISVIHEVKHEHESTTLNSTASLPTVTGKISVNRSIGVPSELSIPVRNGSTPRKNISGIIQPTYTRKKPKFQTELNKNRGIKTKVRTSNTFFRPTGATPTIEREKIKHIPKVIMPNELDNHRLNNITESEVQDLEKVQEGIIRSGAISETVLIPDKESSQDRKTMQSGTSKIPMGENERKIFSLGGAKIHGQNPSEGDKISSGTKRPTLKREFSKKPGASQVTASTVSFIEPEDENVHKVTNTHDEMSKNLSRDTPRSFENVGSIPNVKPNILHNPSLKNNTESEVQDLEKVQEGIIRTGAISETVLISNKESSKDRKTMQSGTSKIPMGENERKIFSLGGAKINGQNPSEGDKISSGTKRPTLKREFSKKPGASKVTASTVSFIEPEDENVHIVTNTHDEMSKNLSRDTPRSFENVGSIPNVKPNILHNPSLKNNTESQVQDLEKVQEGIIRTGAISETVLISDKESSQDRKTMQSGTSKIPMGENERKIFSLEGANINSQNPSEGDKISSGTKRPTLKKEPSKKPGASQVTASTVSFIEPEDENVHIVTNPHDEMSKNLSRDPPRSFENVGSIPNAKSNILHNPSLKNNTETKTPSKPQNTANLQDLENVQQGKTQVGDNSETLLISNTKDPNIRQSESSNSPTGGKERTIFSAGTAEVDNRKKVPNTPTLRKELPKEQGIIQLPTVSFRDTENIDTVTNGHVETSKNISGDTPIRFENIEATKELEHIKLNEDRVDENPGEVLSNQNRVDTAQSYSGERYAIPVVSERLPNVEEIKGSKLFSLSPEDTAEGFKAHVVSDEVTDREKAENKLHSTCLGDCNTTSTQHSQSKPSQRRTPLAFEREKGPAQDCADYMMKSRRNGVYRVTPRPKKTTFPVFCDMESPGGGWTVIQHRFDGSTSFNRTWDEYKNGFGKLMGEFWLGNDKIHLLTKAKNMSLRIEIEDSDGIREYAQYDRFYVANESQNYRLSIDGYSGTAGNALQFNKKYNHDQKFFTTPDRDNDQYPSGNCGAYYSSGWWFDACMSANLNGKYYQSKYKGVRNGIFWGTWHNITMEYYPTNERQSFRTVKMMIRPKK